DPTDGAVVVRPGGANLFGQAEDAHLLLRLPDERAPEHVRMERRHEDAEAIERHAGGVKLVADALRDRRSIRRSWRAVEQPLEERVTGRHRPRSRAACRAR